MTCIFMQKYQNITNPKTERGHYMNRTNLPSILYKWRRERSREERVPCH